MSYTLVPFTPDYLEPAVALFIANYKDEQEHSPLLPSRVIDEPAWIHGKLQSKLFNPGVVVVEQDRVLAYMLTGDQFPWKGQQAAIVLEYGHGAIATKKRELYQRMYMYLGQEWVSQQFHLHLIRHFAHDTILQETLYQLGFGAILAERLRDFSAVAERQDMAINIEQDVSKLLTLQTEHNRYYPKAPIFIQKSTEKHEVRAELEAHAQQGDVIFVYAEQQEPCAYMIVGTSMIGGEGFLLEQTNTAQIKSAYARPEIRGKGIGMALLQRAIAWSHQQGYERVFVEHETANVYGGNFWRTYFTPYVYASMRYIDPKLDIDSDHGCRADGERSPASQVGGGR
jgi:GNAT superfamily N-acetyltransferase